MKHQPKFTDYTHPAGGWGSVQSLGRSLTREHVPLSGSRILTHQNKPDGFACVSCAWAKPAKPRPFEFCEEGAKATTTGCTSLTTSSAAKADVDTAKEVQPAAPQIGQIKDVLVDELESVPSF